MTDPDLIIHTSFIRFTDFARKWTLEDVERLVEQAKWLLSWTKGEEMTSMRAGANRKEFHYVVECMISHSLYFFYLSLPTVAYAPHFMNGTSRLVSLDSEEVEIFEWILDWCHEGGTLSEHLLRDRHPEIELDSWIIFWCITDCLGIEKLQGQIGTLLLAQLQNGEMPSFHGINYIWRLGLFRMQQDATTIWNSIANNYAARRDTALDTEPGRFAPSFLSQVKTIRYERGFANPGDITAFSKPPPEKAKTQDQNGIVPSNGSVDGHEDSNGVGEPKYIIVPESPKPSIIVPESPTPSSVVPKSPRPSKLTLKGKIARNRDGAREKGNLDLSDERRITECEPLNEKVIL